MARHNYLQHEFPHIGEYGVTNRENENPKSGQSKI